MFVNARARLCLRHSGDCCNGYRVVSWKQLFLSLCGHCAVLRQVRKIIFLLLWVLVIKKTKKHRFEHRYEVNHGQSIEKNSLGSVLCWWKYFTSSEEAQLCFLILASPFFEKAARINKVKSDHVKRTPLGQEITLKCFYEGQPPPEVFWTKGKKMLGDKCKQCLQKVEHQPGVSTLRVTPFRDVDFGDYKCKARNKLGFQHIMIKLREDKSKS